MATFNNNYRRVLSSKNKLNHRFMAFKWCLTSYCRLTGEDFALTFDGVGLLAGFPKDGRPTAEQLMAAARLLADQRDLAVRRQPEFDALQRRAKVRYRSQDSGEPQ